MKPDDIRRIAEIIGLEHKFIKDAVCIPEPYGKGDFIFEPDVDWCDTGMLLEWLNKRCARVEIQGNIIYYSYSSGVSGHIMGKPVIGVVSSSVEAETLQLAICNAVLSVGEALRGEEVK